MLSVQNLILGKRLIDIFLPSLKTVAIAQLVRASDCGSEGRGFEPHWPPQKRLCLFVESFLLKKRGLVIIEHFVQGRLINTKALAIHQKALLKGFTCKKTHDFALFLRE